MYAFKVAGTSIPCFPFLSKYGEANTVLKVIPYEQDVFHKKKQNHFLLQDPNSGKSFYREDFQVAQLF